MTLEDSAATETVEAPDDIRSALTAALAVQETAPGEPKTDAAEIEPKEDSAPGRTRGTDGKFAKADPEPKDAEPKAAEPATSEPKTESKTEPPANWSEQDKAAFKGLPQDAQGFLLKRHTQMEADYTKKTQAIAEFRRDYEPIRDMFAPHADAMRQSGYTPAKLIDAWMGVEKKLQAGGGVDVISDLVRGYKIDTGAVARALGMTAPAAGVEKPAAPAGQTAALPPELAQKLAGMEQFIAQQQQERQAAAAAAQREAENRVMSTIDQFRGATDTSGALLHPHYAEVEEHMTRLAIAARTSGKPVPSLNDLYDEAVWANPSTRAQLLEAQRAADQAQHKAAEEEARREARAKAEKARRAGSSVTGSPGQTAAPAHKGGDTLRSALLAAVEDAEAA